MNARKTIGQAAETAFVSPFEELLNNNIKTVLDPGAEPLKQLLEKESGQPAPDPEQELVTMCPTCGRKHWPFDGTMTRGELRIFLAA